MFEKTINWANRNVVWLFLAALLVVFLAHVSTVAVYPAPWLDEVQLIENGRCAVFDRGGAWSILLQEDGGAFRPALIPTYLSGMVAESVDRMAGVWWGHRVFSLAGLLAAAALCAIWLHKKAVPLGVSCAVALLFCTDAHVVKSAHFYRPDVWALAMAFLTALAVEKYVDHPARHKMFFLIGLFLSVQVLFWFSAIFGLSLVAAEWLALSQRPSRTARSVWRECIALGLGFASGLLVLLVLPFGRDVSQFASFFLAHPDMKALQEASQALDGVDVKQSGMAIAAQHIMNFATVVLRSAFLWALATVGLLLSFSRNKIFGWMLCGALLFMLLTRAYCFRVIYFYPLALFFAAQAWRECALRWEARHPVRLAVALLLGAGVMFGLGANVLGVNLVAATGDVSRQRAELSQKLGGLVGRGPQKVYVFSWQPYFVGRQLGWQMFSFLPDNRKFLFDPRAKPLLAEMDYVLEQKPGVGMIEDGGAAPLTDEERDCLAANGFVPVGSADVVDSSRLPPLLARLRVLVWASEYPSFAVWKKQRPPL